MLLGRRVVGVDLYFPGVVLPEGRGVFAVQVVDIVEDLGHVVELIRVVVPADEVADVNVANIDLATAHGLDVGHRRIETVVADRVRIDRHDVPVRQVAVHGGDEIVGELHGEIEFAGRRMAKGRTAQAHDQSCR